MASSSFLAFWLKHTIITHAQQRTTSTHQHQDIDTVEAPSALIHTHCELLTIGPTLGRRHLLLLTRCSVPVLADLRRPIRVPIIAVVAVDMAEYILEQEEMDKHSSALVAPLNIQKSPKRSRVNVSGHSRQSSSRGTRSIRSQSQSQISPPLTPKTSSEVMAQQPPPQPIFHNYLRAFYHYSPSSTVSSSTDESSITVAIKQGDVILVHSVHPNGWADGTLLASGARGWLPTNYCEPYDHPTIRSLLNALTHLWDLVRNGENGDLFAFTKQDYVRGMIAGIRFFLVSEACSESIRLAVELTLTLYRREPVVSQESRISSLHTSVCDECEKVS